MKSLIGPVLVIYLFLSLVGALYLSHYPSNRLLALRLSQGVDFYDNPPQFRAIEDTREKKSEFFEYFSRIVDNENQRLQTHRDILTRLKQDVNGKGKFDKNTTEIVDIFAGLYNLTVSEDKTKQLNTLLDRVNIVPRSLVLAQAANESAWGTSRFAVEGNNYFGQWCFTSGCGLIPNSRASHAKHEVKVFSSPAESVRSYLHNINTHKAYANLRKIRAEKMQQNNFIKGIALAEGLSQYSERGAEYIKEIQDIIRLNQLEEANLTEHLGAK